MSEGAKLRTSAVRAALLAVAVALAGNIATNTVAIPDGWDFAAWVVLLVLDAVLVRGERQRWRQAQAAGFPADLGEVVDSLADVLVAKWRREEDRHRFLQALLWTPATHHPPTPA